jgi:hypothetical protein
MQLQAASQRARLEGPPALLTFSGDNDMSCGWFINVHSPIVVLAGARIMECNWVLRAQPWLYMPLYPPEILNSILRVRGCW